MKKTRMAKNPENVGPKDESLLPINQPNAQEKPFLRKIRGVESSFGQDLDHPEVTSGIQAGDTAVGQYALMPNTIQEFTDRMIRKGNAPAIVRRLQKVEDPQEVADQVASDPELEDLYAKIMAGHVLHRQGGNEEKAAFSWNQGHNLNPAKITPEKLEASDYVQKFRKLGNTMKPKLKITE